MPTAPRAGEKGEDNLYSPNIGFTPRTRAEMTKQAYDHWVALTGTGDTFAQFQGSNMHLVLNLFFEEIEKLEEKIALLQAHQFTYWQNHHMAIQASLGSAYEGWQKVFAPLCTGLDIQGSMENPGLKPGEIVLYFDNLTATEKELQEALLRCKNIAEPTIAGDQKVQITYSNGQTREYKYFNLRPEDYTPIQVQIHVTYEKRGLNYKDSDFIAHFKANFARLNYINKAFYPESYMDMTPFPGVADFTLKTKLAGEADWAVGTREIGPGHKYTIESVTVSV